MNVFHFVRFSIRMISNGCSNRHTMQIAMDVVKEKEARIIVISI